jgi:hypothetical protein
MMSSVCVCSEIQNTACKRLIAHASFYHPIVEYALAIVVDYNSGSSNASMGYIAKTHRLSAEESRVCIPAQWMFAWNHFCFTHGHKGTIQNCWTGYCIAVCVFHCAN